MGRRVQALISVRLRVHDRVQIDRFTEKMPQLPGVLSMFHVSGATDYLLHIAVAHRGAARLGAGQPGHRPSPWGTPRPPWCSATSRGTAGRCPNLVAAAGSGPVPEGDSASVTAASPKATSAHSATKPATAACRPKYPAARPSPITGKALPR